MAKFGWKGDDALLVSKTRMRYPYYSMIMEAYRYGKITLEDVKDQLRHRAFHPDVVDTMASIAEERKRRYERSERARLLRTIAKREQALERVLEAYKERQIEKEDALAILEDYDYNRDEAEYMLESAEIEEKRRERETSVGILDALFIEGKITEETYRLRLKELAYSNKAIDQRVMYAKMRKAGKVRRLTASQWARLFREKHVTEIQFRNAMREYGYPDDDIDKLVLLYAPPVPKPPKPLRTTVGLDIEVPVAARPVKPVLIDSVIGLSITIPEESLPMKIVKVRSTIGIDVEIPEESKPVEIVREKSTIGIDVEPLEVPAKVKRIDTTVGLEVMV